MRSPSCNTHTGHCADRVTGYARAPTAVGCHVRKRPPSVQPRGVSTIGAVAPNVPPDDFNTQVTRHANFGAQRPPAQPPGTTPPPAEEPEPSLDAFGEETEPTEWYRRPVVLIGWALVVLILVALIVYGIIQLTQEPGTSNLPSTKTTTTTTPTSTTTTTTTSPPTTTTPTTTPTTTSEVVPPSQQPTHTQEQPTHRRHWPTWLPSTLPPGWF